MKKKDRKRGERARVRRGRERRKRRGEKKREKGEESRRDKGRDGHWVSAALRLRNSARTCLFCHCRAHVTRKKTRRRNNKLSQPRPALQHLSGFKYDPQLLTMSSSSLSPPPDASFLCPTCLQLGSTPVPLPCGHSFCLPCLCAMDRGLDRHCCPECRQEYRPHNYHARNKETGLNLSAVESGKSQEHMGSDGSFGFHNKVQFLGLNVGSVGTFENPGTNQNIDKSNFITGLDKMTNISQNFLGFKDRNAKDVDKKKMDGTGSYGFQSKPHVLESGGNSSVRYFEHLEASQNLDELIGKLDEAANNGQTIPASKNSNAKDGREETKGSGSYGFQSKNPFLGLNDCSLLNLEQPETRRRVYRSSSVGGLDKSTQTGQNKSAFRVKLQQEEAAKKTSLLSSLEAENTISQQKMQEDSKDVEGIGNFQRQTSLLGQELSAGNETFQNKAIEETTACAAFDSELYNYLKSKVAEPKFNSNAAETPLVPISNQDVTMLVDVRSQEPSLDEQLSLGFQNKTTNLQANVEERDLERRESPVSEEDERKMSESKSKLASQASDLSDKLQKAETVLGRELAFEHNVTTANAKLRENATKLVEDLTSFAENYGKTITQLIEREFNPGEEIVRRRVEKASEFSKQIKRTMQEADDLLKEKNANVYASRIQSLESEMLKCNEENLLDETQEEVSFDLSKLCPELERLSGEFREKLGRVQRSLRSEFNPSEVTFDPETLHPNLVLSEDLKTVKFSPKKQPYEANAKRFSSFTQVLSAQSFSAGVHRWELQLDGAPWILGVCVASSLPRSGLPSALETLSSSWALMWNQNQLTAFDRSKGAPLQKTSQASRRLELRLDCDRGHLDFYNLSQTSGRSLIHRFKVQSKEPLSLAYRMLSGETNGRVTICS
ncbi:hypothetical protein WMY93_011880 [Mugilogobius chulae]|uniref:Uncharacterized protein n=1 Tax=Mugilogobius chulae TaxID=88201 RepID=A0AAW0PCP6_9GOBI